MKRLHGMTCATITPMRADGSIDMESAARLYQHMVQKGIHCLYPNGTNGESLSLREDERRQLASLCVSETNGRAVVYIQCGASTVDESYAHLRHAQQIAADGAGLMTPVFFPVDESAMAAYYTNALQVTPNFPMYIYNIAARTSNDVSETLLSQLMRDHANLLGIKFSSPDLLRLSAYVAACPFRTTDVLIGCDALALPCLVLGGAGYVSGPGAVFPLLYAGLYNAFMDADMALTTSLQQEIRCIAEAMTGIPEIPAIKYMLMRQGIIATDVCRSPLRPLTAPEKARLNALLDAH